MEIYFRKLERKCLWICNVMSIHIYWSCKCLQSYCTSIFFSFKHGQCDYWFSILETSIWIVEN